MRVTLVLLFTLLSACSGLYNSPNVVSGETDAGVVTIVPITMVNITQANSAPYRPRTLPAILSRSAGINGSAIGAGSLPEPAFSPEIRPGSLPTRLPPAYQNGSYKIGVGDVVLLATPKSGNSVEALTGLLAAQNQRQGYTVQDDGAIAIPEAGRVNLKGLTLGEAEAEIFQALVANQIDPTFSIEISEFNSKRIALGGAVRNPMTIPITLQSVNLTEAITAAGGTVGADPDTGLIRIFRDGGLYQIPLKAYQDDATIQQLVLKAGDSVFVDTGYDLDRAQGYFEQQIQLATFRQTSRQAALNQLQSEVGLRRAELAEIRGNYLARIELDAIERDYVYIAGEVGVQNRFTLPFERKSSLADALFHETEGVPNRTGNIAELYVLRASNTGAGVNAWHLDATNAANLVLTTRFELRPNDIIFVAEQPVTAFDRFFSQIAPSLAAAQGF